VFHQSKCISTIKRIHSPTATYISSSSFMYLRVPCYCDARLKSSALCLGVKTLHNTIQFFHEMMRFLRYVFVKFLAFRKAFRVFTTVLARKERCWASNLKTRALYIGCREIPAFHANGFDKLRKRKKCWCSEAALHFSFARRNPHEQL